MSEKKEQVSRGGGNKKYGGGDGGGGTPGALGWVGGKIKGALDIFTYVRLNFTSCLSIRLTIIVVMYV